MARRKNFRKDELAAFTAGTVVEILHSTRWVPGKIVDGQVNLDTIGEKYLWIEYTGPTTRTVSKGDRWYGTPGAIRLPVAV